MCIDDSPENVSGARDAALLAARYTTPEQLQVHLAASDALTAR